MQGRGLIQIKYNTDLAQIVGIAAKGTPCARRTIEALSVALPSGPAAKLFSIVSVVPATTISSLLVNVYFVDKCFSRRARGA